MRSVDLGKMDGMSAVGSATIDNIHVHSDRPHPDTRGLHVTDG